MQKILETLRRLISKINIFKNFNLKSIGSYKTDILNWSLFNTKCTPIPINGDKLALSNDIELGTGDCDEYFIQMCEHLENEYWQALIDGHISHTDNWSSKLDQCRKAVSELHNAYENYRVTYSLECDLTVATSN